MKATLLNNQKPKKVSANDMKIGQLALIVTPSAYEGSIVLCIYNDTATNKLVSLNDPGHTWTLYFNGTAPEVIILPPGTIVQISSEC